MDVNEPGHKKIVRKMVVKDRTTIEVSQQELAGEGLAMTICRNLRLGSDGKETVVTETWDLAQDPKATPSELARMVYSIMRIP